MMIKIHVNSIKFAFLALVFCSTFPGLAFGQTPVLLGPDSVAPITDGGIAPVTGTTANNTLPKPTHNWYAVPGYLNINAGTADRFFTTYYANPMSDALEGYGEFAAKCFTKSLDGDDKRKILQKCKTLPIPYNLICAAEIVRELIGKTGGGVCRHHAVMMNEAAEVLGYKSVLNSGWYSNDTISKKGWEGHAWSEVTADGQRYLIDSFGHEYYSMDGPVNPYCGNETKEKGEECDGSNKGCGKGQKCKSCKCTGEIEADFISAGPNSKYLVGGALVLGTALLLSNNSNSNSNDTETDSTGTTETTEPVTEQPAEAAPEPIGDSRDGNYNVSTSVVSNPGNHPILIQNLLLQLRIIGAVLTITQLSNNNNFPRQLTATLSGAAFNALVNGNYAGFNTVFQLVGTINALNQLNFQILVGGNGSLPTGQPITYNAQGSK